MDQSFSNTDGGERPLKEPDRRCHTGASNEIPSVVVGTFQDIPLSNLKSFKVEQLRYELKIRGIDTRGLKKPALQDRLQNALVERVVIQVEPQPTKKKQDTQMRGCPKFANSTPVPEPKSHRGLRAPTARALYTEARNNNKGKLAPRMSVSGTNTSAGSGRSERLRRRRNKDEVC